MKLFKLKLTAKMPYKYDILIHVAMLLLIALGTLMIFSTNVGNTYSDQNALLKTGIKQFAFITAGYILCVFLANNFTMKRAKKLIPFLAVVLFLLLGLTLAFPPVYETRAWIYLGTESFRISIQPSEFLKIFIPVMLAVYVEEAGKRNIKFLQIVAKPAVILLPIFAIMVPQKDLGSLIIALIIAWVCSIIPSHRGLRGWQRITKFLFIALCCAIPYLISADGIELMLRFQNTQHIATRIENTLNPYLDMFNGGYQPTNGLYAIAHSRFFGQGFGSSIVKYGFLTQADTDYIFSVLIEELGIFGLVALCILYLIIVLRLFHYAKRTKNEAFKIILIGVAMYLTIHFIFNIGGVGGIIPLSGIPLLFISSGGSSLVSIMMGLGICQSIISRIRLQRE